MSRDDRYTIVLAETTGNLFKPWGWEICRDGEPLPVRIRESGFKTERTARFAANVALRDFLTGLAQEQAKLDWVGMHFSCRRPQREPARTGIAKARARFHRDVT
jgi:hypothetical protein